ncbi:MAG: SIR2 family NAD-dependent protein deacylase [Bacteroidia bacterium]
MLDKSKPHLVALTGAGVSAESGLKTFRDSDGLWEGYNVYDVATPEAWKKNPEMVQEFYNMRRKSVLEAVPNNAHLALAELEAHFNVSIITQNVDDLHERAGSSSVLHLHGEILFSRSSINDNFIYPINGWELKMGELCELGSQLRPHIVWFGEEVPLIEKAAEIAAQADIFVIVGTSLQVYPAAGLTRFVPLGTPVYLIDPKPIDVHYPNLIEIRKKAGEGMNDLKDLLLN